ncbi:MAG TPA: DUF4058 family protein [Pirellulales bacterium]|nr:DUF4058 family protein [Pirellulales bacterium]
MPNPFPGMDPYLEGDLWTTVHTDLCAEMARQLAPKLRQKYAALSTRRVVLAPPDNGKESGTQGLEPIPHVSVEIRDVAERRLVTCIEVLSPTNKRGPGREEYAGRRHEVEVWPVPLEKPLPEVPVPLLPGDSPVPLELQQALAVVYEIIGYDDLVDYTKPPPGPLAPDEIAWVDERLRSAGRRKV